MLAKRSLVRLGKQMCLNVRLVFYFCRSFCSLSLPFSIGGNGYVYGVVWRFEARTCQTVTRLLDVTPRNLHYPPNALYRCCVFVLCFYVRTCVMETCSLSKFVCAVDMCVCLICMAQRWLFIPFIFISSKLKSFHSSFQSPQYAISFEEGGFLHLSICTIEGRIN